MIASLRTAFTASFIALVGFAASADAQSRIGAAFRVVNTVTADQRVIIKGDGVNQNETVEVGPNGLGELKFDDDTKVAIGAGGRLKLDKFVYDPNKSTGDVAVSLSKGAFRFITGVARKRDYQIKTPGASISVRGTVFDVYIAQNGAEYVLLHEGSIEVCQGDGLDKTRCQVVENPCNVVRVSPQGSVAQPIGWTDRQSELDVTFSEAFPFVLNPPAVDPEIHYTRADVEANKCLKKAPRQQDRADLYEPDVPSTLPPQKVTQVPQQSVPPPPSSVPELPSDDTPPPTNWTGIYIGVHGGGTRGTTDSETVCEDADNYFDVGGGACSSRGGDGDPNTDPVFYELNDTGLSGGLQTGANLQFGAIVLGFEADMSRTDVEAVIDVPAGNSEYFYANYRLSQKMEWFGTARGRVGIAFGNLLVFGTGGLAFGDVSYSFSAEYGTGDGVGQVSDREFKFGYTAGGGFEIGFGRFSFKTEYMYFDLGDDNVSTEVLALSSSRELNIPTAITFRNEFESTGHIARIGLNYRLN
jgi:opacity protein-like surface antigen